MFPQMSNHTAILFIAASLTWASQAQAQSPRTASRLAALRQQNTFQQQQEAVQTAVQQTNILLQPVNRRIAGVTMINLQVQQNALQIAVQQTNAVLQASFRQNGAQSQTAMRQLNTLQTALQQTTSVQSALQRSGGPLSYRQVQTLTQEQAALTALLTDQPPPPPRALSGK